MCESAQTEIYSAVAVAMVGLAAEVERELGFCEAGYNVTATGGFLSSEDGEVIDLAISRRDLGAGEMKIFFELASGLEMDPPELEDAMAAGLNTACGVGLGLARESL